MAKETVQELIQQLIVFHTQQVRVNETRLNTTELTLIYLAQKCEELDCKINRDNILEMQARLKVLKDWIAYDNEKIDYYQFQIN